MSFKLKKKDLANILGNDLTDKWFSSLDKILPKYDIDTPERVAAFLAQCSHESANFSRLEENMNYSASALRRVFGRYFKTDAIAKEYARQPEKIANRVYMDANRTKRGALGNVQEGDGWRFRGRGILQITGRNNYTAFGKTVGMSAEEAAEYIVTTDGSVESACWFWKRGGLNKYVDRGDFETLTKRINGGTIGLADRIHHWEKAKAVFGGKTNTKTNTKSVPNRMLNAGDKGEDVKMLQKALGLKDDGYFGPNTKRAVKRFQSRNGLTPDGVAGPNTYAKLFN